MDYSASNVALWNAIFQVGIISVMVIVSNILRTKIKFVRKTLMPTSVIAGFLLLGFKYLNIVNVDRTFLDMVTYHGIAIGFIAMSLRVHKKDDASNSTLGTAVRSGALIVSTYCIQAVIGLAISLGLAYTIKPDLFKACGILLPMGFGQGPGQANNVGSTYESLGFAGGKSYGLAVAAAGFIVACLVGVVYLNVLSRKKKLQREDYKDLHGSVTIDIFQDAEEAPISESIDRLSIQAALILFVYLITYLAIWGVSSLLGSKLPGLAATINPLLWGFNFIIASLFAILTRNVILKMKKLKLMQHQYQNNYLLSRISGLAFDAMIISGIASIDFNDISGLWLPFIVTVVVGTIVTFIYLKIMCKIVYKGYEEEGFISMFGMLTGTISSGILLVREVDPNFKTPAANNLVSGSGMGIAFGAPILILIGLAPKSTGMAFAVMGLSLLYFAILLLILTIKKAPNTAAAAIAVAPADLGQNETENE
ncbi:MAG: sodium:glutamate symporter [Treponema sp.]|nr:sodium:glutamate symporter [Treponema sp.]